MKYLKRSILAVSPNYFWLAMGRDDVTFSLKFSKGCLDFGKEGEEVSLCRLSMVRHPWLIFPKKLWYFGSTLSVLMDDDVFIAPVLGPKSLVVFFYLPNETWIPMFVRQQVASKGEWRKSTSFLKNYPCLQRCGYSYRNTLNMDSEILRNNPVYFSFDDIAYWTQKHYHILNLVSSMLYFI